MCVCISMCIRALTFTISQLERGQRNASTGLMCTVSHSSLDQKKKNKSTHSTKSLVPLSPLYSILKSLSDLRLGFLFGFSNWCCNPHLVPIPFSEDHKS